MIALGAGRPDRNGLLINTSWAGYNLLLLTFGLLLLKQRPQRRVAVRLIRSFPLTLRWNGQRVEAISSDLSETGLSLRVAPALPLPEYLDVTLLDLNGKELQLRARLVRCEMQAGGELEAAVAFIDVSELQHRKLVELMFSPESSWNSPHSFTLGAPEHLWRILGSVVQIFSRPRTLRRMAPRFRCSLSGRILPETSAGFPARITDISAGGAAIRLQRGQSLPNAEQFSLSVIWNEIERTTLKARIRNVRNGAAGERVLGLVFVRPGPQEQADLRRHLYSGEPAAVAERAPA